MKTETKVLMKAGIINCGIATALINGILNYFTMADAPIIASPGMLVSFMITAFACGAICPLFGGMTLKGILKGNPYFNLGDKSEHLVAKYIPNQVVAGVIAIGIFVGAILGAIPYGILTLCSIEFSLPRIAWVVAIAIYSGTAATLGMYFGLKRAYFAQKSV